VTEASRGIGHDLALALAGAGARTFARKLTLPACPASRTFLACDLSPQLTSGDETEMQASA
jgi:NAD(P)-dependent dehydrogenase (short-subunit alcohol dehydrogenase family)